MERNSARSSMKIILVSVSIRINLFLILFRYS